MESSIRDIFIFLKLSWGLENDNTLFKKHQKTITFAIFPNPEKRENTLYPWCLPLAEILRVQPKKIASRYLGYLPPHIYPSSCFLYFGVVSEFYSPDTFTIKHKSSTRSWLSVPRNFIQEGFWYMKQFKQGFWTFCLEGIVRDRSPNPQGSC